MPQRAIPAVFMRGGTSKAIMFHARDLPADRAEWDAIFMAALGTPDPYGRQLNGMGGGVSSLSKICVLAPSEREDADIDYTFAQVLIREARVDWKGNCGNMSSAVGPFAVDEGLVRPNGTSATVRIYNTNTRKIIHNTFELEDGRAKVLGDLSIPGVGGTGAPVRPAEAFDIDGVSVEAEAWAFLAVRARLGLPITFPGTTGVRPPLTGGVLAGDDPVG